ncbi:MAG: hypothetical protein QXU87_09795 [Candidatus Caldarchaeum sp.]
MLNTPAFLTRILDVYDGKPVRVVDRGAWYNRLGIESSTRHSVRSREVVQGDKIFYNNKDSQEHKGDSDRDSHNTQPTTKDRIERVYSSVDIAYVLKASASFAREPLSQTLPRY